MTTYWLSEADLAGRLGERAGEGVYLPLGGESFGPLCAEKVDASVRALRSARPGHSPKSFFFPSAESVGRYGPAGGGAATAVSAPAATVVGLRGCELRALKYLDKVLLEGPFQDPSYAARREALRVVSVDCIEARETCFCTLVGGAPYAEDGFDVNLTPLEGGFVAEVAGQKGAAWLGDGLPEASAEQLAARQQLRERMAAAVAEQNAEYSLPPVGSQPVLLPDDDAAEWSAFAADCVECAACTNGCPTCHCFYLYDQSAGEEQFERVRTWDSCLLGSYHRMAGVGANMKPTPRPRLRSRLANRVLHKFSYSPEQYGLAGCVGCGRCIEGCLGAIDIREVVQELSR